MSIDNISKQWNKVYDAFHSSDPARMSVWNEEATPFYVRLIDFLKHQGVKTVMDAGCGDGRNIKPYVEAGFQVIGVDGSSSAIEVCKKNLGNPSNLKLLQEDLTTIKEPQGLDAIICDHVLVHIKNVEQTLDSFYNLLKHGGYAMIEFTSPFDSTFGQGEKISENEFIQKVVYLRYDTLDDVCRMMKKFNILCITSEHSTDPPHGPGYIRTERHAHHSYFVFAQK